MLRIINKLRYSKYKRFIEGLLFALISMITIILCVLAITDKSATDSDVILPFILSIISLLTGFVVMFHDSEQGNRKNYIL